MRKLDASAVAAAFSLLAVTLLLACSTPAVGPVCDQLISCCTDVQNEGQRTSCFELQNQARAQGNQACTEVLQSFVATGACTVATPSPGPDAGDASVLDGPGPDGMVPDLPDPPDLPAPDSPPRDLGSDPDATTGQPCDTDADCPGGMCNDALGQCAAPQPLGGPCFTDDECLNRLCNSALDQCAEPQPLKGPCFTDDECENRLCNSALDQCAEPQPLGGPCFTDDECLDGLCNSALDECAELQPPGGPCFTDDECLSGSCVQNACS